MTKTKIKQIIIMGGAILVPGNLNPPIADHNMSNKLAEWNIYIDPVAADQVFKSGIPIKLIPLFK